jgi:hypothetical protein
MNLRARSSAYRSRGISGGGSQINSGSYRFRIMAGKLGRPKPVVSRSGTGAGALWGGSTIGQSKWTRRSRTAPRGTQALVRFLQTGRVWGAGGTDWVETLGATRRLGARTCATSTNARTRRGGKGGAASVADGDDHEGIGMGLTLGFSALYQP